MRIVPKQTLTRIIPIILIPGWSQTNAPLVVPIDFPFSKSFLYFHCSSYRLLFQFNVFIARSWVDLKFFTACHLPLPRNGLVILYILNVSFRNPHGQLFSRISLISGKTFNAHLDFVFHFRGSGLSRSSLYLPVYKAHAWNRAASSTLQPCRLPCFYGTRKVLSFGSLTHFKAHFRTLIFCASQSRNRISFRWCIVWRRQFTA